MKETPFDKEIFEAEGSLKRLYRQRADFLCPFKPGDIITNGEKTGKVLSVRPNPSNFNPYTVFVKWQLKSGDYGVARELWSFYDNAFNVVKPNPAICTLTADAGLVPVIKETQEV